MSDAANRDSSCLVGDDEAEAISRGFAKLADASADGAPGAKELLAQCAADTTSAELIKTVFRASPFLSELVIRDPGFACKCLTAELPSTFDLLLVDMTDAMLQSQDSADAKKLLRVAKSRSSLLIALADISGRWALDDVLTSLTRFADTASNETVNWLLRDAMRAGKFEPVDPNDPAVGSGYVVLAMGKHGAHELNYSSDIDLIVLYDPDVAPLTAGNEPAKFFVRLTKRFVELMQDITEDGYVLRVDLRLRPDPRATQIAISFEAACIYYENMGQNWERAAMIKVRPVAGDLALGGEFKARMVPYIWRKYLDFAAIADVQSLKRQIHSVKGHGTINVPGHNVKLGRGGIREIEFFVQTQQLIAGGRNPNLRGQQTLQMLDALSQEDWITSEAADQLKQAYEFLRGVEHRIQMINDEQTHELPQSGQPLEVFAKFCGYDCERDFTVAIRSVFEQVQNHYNALFEDADELAGDAGSLVFTGGEDDPETLATLQAMGFAQSSEISAMIRSWHFGRYAATRSSVARERLTEIMPGLLRAIAGTGDPDATFIAFDRFMAGLPAGVQLFSMLRANTQLLDLIALILGAAPRLAEQLSNRPKVLDAVLDPGFFDNIPSREETRRATQSVTSGSSPFEEQLDRARVIGKELMFQVGVRILSETVNAGQAGQAYSDLADVLLDRMLDAAQLAVRERHGDMLTGQVAIIALGKLGGREMTAASDLDLILIYNHSADEQFSNGQKPLSASQYYARLTQRLIAAISSQTAEGSLFEVDMRLRPSGSKGPVATSLESFRTYHAVSAWTWEKLALSRSRLVAGDSSLCDAVSETIRDALCAERNQQETITEIVDMRNRIHAEHGSLDPWNLKYAHGGMVDCEFIVQGLQILHAHRKPGILDQGTAGALGNLHQTGLLSNADAHTLTEVNALYHRLMQVLRLCTGGKFDPEQAPADLSRLLANAAHSPDIASAQSLLMDHQEQVDGMFNRLLPA